MAEFLTASSFLASGAMLLFFVLAVKLICWGWESNCPNWGRVT